MASTLEIGFDFESGSSRSGSGPQSSSRAKDYLSAIQESSCLDEETKKISRALADLGKKMSKGGKLQAPDCRLSAI